MANFIKHLDESGNKAEFETQIQELSDFIKDIELYMNIEVGAEELNSLKAYIEECNKRLQYISHCISDYEERKAKSE